MAATRFSSPQRVGDLLTRAIPALGGHMLEETIRREWSMVVGPEVARRSRPAALDRGVLEVRADNSPWLGELRLRSSELLGLLQARYGAAVTGLRCALGPVGPASGSARAPRRGASPSPLHLAPGEAQEIEAALGPVRDPDLAAALRRLLTKDALARRQRRAEAPAGEPS